MSEFFEIILPRIRRNRAISALLALSAFALAFLARWALQDVLPYRIPFATFFIAVLVATLVAGGAWGIIILVLCAVAAWMTFLPTGTDVLGHQNIVAVAIFAFVGGLIVAIVHLMNHAFENLAEQRLRANEWLHNSALSEARLEQLNLELRHRTKNMFAILAALVSQTARDAESPLAMSETIRSRLRAMGTAQDLLLARRYSGSELLNLVEECLSPLKPEQDDRLQIEGPIVILTPDTATPLALVIHELATNAVKYGSWSNQSGVVNIRWTVRNVSDEARELTLEWQESGGPPVKEPKREGLGSSLIKSGVPNSKTSRSFSEAGFHLKMAVILKEEPSLPSDAVALPFKQPRKDEFVRSSASRN